MQFKKYSLEKYSLEKYSLEKYSLENTVQKNTVQKNTGRNTLENYFLENTIVNIATGKTSQAITPFHFFGNFNFFNLYHQITFTWLTESLTSLLESLVTLKIQLGKNTLREGVQNKSFYDFFINSRHTYQTKLLTRLGCIDAFV